MARSSSQAPSARALTAILGGVAYALAIVAGLLFGAGDQYLGTLTAGSLLGTWTWTVSGMSAPWLVLPFVTGLSQRDGRRAAVLGMVATLAALVGYFAMAQSPFEGARLDEFWPRVVRMVSTGYNPLWIVGGLLTGPLYGLLGHRWRSKRWWVSAAAVAVALCLEPLARAATGMLSGPPVVWASEIAIGAIAGLGFGLVIAGARQAEPS
jgi:hypothetical protein